MRIANNKTLELFLVVVVCIALSWAQKSNQNTAVNQQIAAASSAGGGLHGFVGKR